MLLRRFAVTCAANERPPGYSEAMTGHVRGHERIDRRSLALHRAIADKLRADPALLSIAHENLARWLAADVRSLPYRDAWIKILSRPLNEILALMIEESERMTALRQATPFAGILRPAERWAVYARFEPVAASAM